MTRCKNCNVSMSDKSILPFCGDRCLREYGKSSDHNKDFEAGPCFNLIGAALENLFHSPREYDKETQKRNIGWLKSPVVHAWCDCSDNFNNDKLVKMYETSVR